MTSVLMLAAAASLPADIVVGFTLASGKVLYVAPGPPLLRYRTPGTRRQMDIGVPATQLEETADTSRGYAQPCARITLN